MNIMWALLLSLGSDFLGALLDKAERNVLRISYLLLIAVMPTNAFAHLGHVGELAGHGHWIAIGAGIAIAGLGALLGNKSKGETSADPDCEETGDCELDSELEGATA